MTFHTSSDDELDAALIGHVGHHVSVRSEMVRGFPQTILYCVSCNAEELIRIGVQR